MHQLVITLSPFHRWPIPNLKSFQLLSSIFYGVLIWRDLVSDEWKIDPDRFIWCLHLTLRENMLQWLACRVSTTTVQVVKSLVVPSIAIFLTCSLAVCLNPFLNSDSNAFSMRKSMSVACLRFFPAGPVRGSAAQGLHLTYSALLSCLFLFALMLLANRAEWISVEFQRRRSRSL